ncbi:LamG-like jellyroll fold domain-containing protein [Streptomyces sp. NPDC008159]|uniref:LamG-like jellyroll fold domain-containing protein n=1 Tax=Streptomyces sp. NPDC008159 TaxID=3364817 RepID=UPI0036E0B558
MAVLAGTEHAVVAADRSGSGSSGDAPDQQWGTADGRSHKAFAEATDAAAKGGNDGPLKGRGELPVEGGTGTIELGGTPKPPEPGPVKQVAAASAPATDGFDTDDSKEVKDKRKERERTFLNEDGSYTTRFYSESVNFRAKDGSWKDIDTTLVPQEESGPRTMSAEEGDWETRSTEAPIEFAGSADADPLVRMQVGDGLSIGYAVDGASAAVGQADGSVITYPDVRRDSDLELIAGSNSVKETLILKDGDAPTTWRFPLELQGLTAGIDEHGSVVFADADGNQRAWMPAGWMQDSNLAEDANEGAISSGVTYSLDEASGRQILVMKLDQEWLSAAKRVFPVRVDPSVKSFDSTSGTYVQSPYNQNFSSDTVLKVGTYDGGSHKAAAFLRFTGVESTLKNAWVLNTNLALYNTWSQSCTARPVTVHPITSNWSESTTTKYPGPSTGSSLASKSFAHGWRPAGAETWSCGPAWESIKLGSAGRKLVNDWTHARKKNYGLAVKASTSDSKGWKQFGSDDYPNGKPSLDVTWTKYGATYTMGDFTAPVTATAQGVQKLTIKNQGQETWPKGGDYKLRYNLYDSKGKEIEDSDKIAYTEMPEAVSPGESVTVDAKIAPLAPATYTLQWTMTDYGVSRFTTAGVPGPAIKFSAVNIPPQLTAESPGSGAVVDTLTPTLWAKGKDSDGYPKATLHYTFEVCEVEGSDLRKNCKKGTRSDETQWAVPSGWLSWGKTYAWYAYAYDGDETSARPGAALISTEVPQPTVTSHLGGADSGKEIGTRSGNYVTAATDAALTTVGPELAVTRTYNSLDPRSDGAFGSGWSTRWDMRLRQEAETGMVLVTLADGSQVRFGKNADGTYAGPAGGSLTLQNQSGAWQLRERSGSVYHFLAGGVLSRIVDSAGRGQKVQHQTETGGPVTKVTDELSGRSLNFTWSAGHVDTVTTSAVGPDAPGLTWSYTYDGDRLTQVCPPSSATKCTQYAYGTGSVYRSGVLDASPTSYWRLGESEGATAASDAPSRTGLNDAAYRDVTLGGASVISGTSDTSAGFDGTDSAVELPSDTLQSTAYPTIELWFKTAKASAVLVGLQDEELGDKPTSYRPVLNIDAAGKLRGEFRRVGVTGATGPITSTAAVTDNAWHHAVLTASATGQTLYLDGKKVGSIVGAVADQSREYAYLGAGYASDSWMGVATGEYRFAGQMDEVALYSHPLNAATVAEHYAARTAVGQITKVTLPSGRIHATAVYDSGSGRLKEHTDANGGTWTVSAPSYSNASSSYARTIQGGGATGYWRLGERSGSEAASPLGEELNGSYLDGARPGSPGIFTSGDDTSAAFDGTGAVEVPTETLGTATAMSVELWFKTTEPGVLATMQNAEFGDTPTGWRPMLLIDTAGQLRGKFSPDATSLISGKAVTDGQWHHVTLTGNSGAQALYLDGRKQAHNQYGVPTVRHPHVLIGGGYASAGWDDQASGYRNFTGQIDEVAFYDKTIVPFTLFGSAWLPSTSRSNAPAAHFQARKDLTSGSDTQYQGVTTADTPAAYWRLGEASGTALASELGGSDATATFHPDTGAVDAGLDDDGIFGPSGNSALSADGRTYTELPGSLLAGTTELAVELWFNTSTPTGVLLGLQDAPINQVPGSFRPVLNIDEAGKLRAEFRRAGVTGATGPITSTQAVTDGQWHHVVLSADATAQTLYLDGVKVGSIAGAVSDQSRPYAYLGAGYASESWMGGDPDPYYYQGSLDEVALYRHPLTADQVSAHYRAQAEPADSALTATVKVTDPKQKTSSATYDALRGQRMVSKTDPTGAVTGFAYDTGGNLHTLTDPNGHATITGHDKRGNTVSTTTCRDADSCWTSFSTYHADEANPLDLRNDKLLTVRDQRSKDHKDDRYRTSFTYNSLGLPTSTVRADGSSSSTTYTAGTEAAVGGGTVPAGLVDKQTTPGGAVTANRYYSNGDLAEVTSPSGLVTKYTYDGLGRKLSETQISDTYPNGVTTTYAYDKASHVVTETGAGVKNEITGTTHTAQIKRAYDEDGNLLSETVKDTTGGDAERVTAYHYNEQGLNDSVTDAELNTTRFEHDELGRVEGMTDAANSHFTYAYTARGQHSETVLDDWRGDPSGTLRDLVLVSNAYDPAGRLASTTDAMGATTAYTYFDDGLPATTTAKQVTQSDASKRDIVLESNTYDAAGHLTKQITGGGRTTETFTVDALGRTERSVLDPGGLGRATDYRYDADDRIKEESRTITGDKKLSTTSDYDVAGNLKKQTVTDGTTTHTTTHTYDQRGLELTSVTPRGNESGASAAAYTTTYRYDELGRLVQETAPRVEAEENGGAATAVKPVTRTGYNAFGDVTEVMDARGHVTRTETDRLGRTTAVTLPGYTPPGGSELTAVLRTTYTPLGLQESVTDPLGRVTGYGYDQLGRMINKTDPPADPVAALLGEGSSEIQVGPVTAADGGGISSYTWTPTGLQLSATDPTGARAEATYDELGRQLTSTVVERYPNLQNLTSHYTWDDAGNQTLSKTPAGRITSATYNPAGETMSVSDSVGTTRFAYDGLGRQTEFVDATERKTVTTYNALDEVTATTDYGTGTTALRTIGQEYDADGNRTALISAEKKVRTTFTYDALGRMTKQVEPVTSTKSITTTFGYDAEGNRTRFTDGRSNSTVYTFNSWGLPESTIEPATTAGPNAADRTWTTVYNRAGQPVTELLPGGVKRESTYDGLGRLIGETGSGAEAATTARTLEYDLAGRLTVVGVAGGATRNTFTYNDRGQLLTAAGAGGVSEFTYDLDGNMTHRKSAAGSTDYGYDSAGRLDWAWDSLTGNDIWYDFDAAGRPKLERYAVKPTGSQVWTESTRRAYSYDGLGRLTGDKVTLPDGTGTITSTDYTHDLDDQLKTKKTTGTAGATTHTYGYDDAGRLTSWAHDGSTTAYEWDDSGNRTKSGSADATFDARNRQLTDGTKTFTYTPRGTLSSVNSGTGTARTLTFDAFERKITDSGAEYSYDSLDRIQTRNSTTFAYDGGSGDLATDGDSKYNRTPEGTLLSASTGTTKLWALTDQHTDLVAGLSADGKTVNGSTAYDPFGEEIGTNGTTPSVGYQSGYTDPTSGDVNMAARWYQPGTGSFGSRDTWQLDPVPSAQGNRYGYANDDPVNGTDPTGHVCACGGGSGRVGVGGGVRRGSGGGRYGNVAPKGYTPSRRSGGRTRVSGRSNRNLTNSRAQARKNARELARVERWFSRPRPVGRTSTGRGNSYRGCTYGCSTTPYRGTSATRTTRPPKPPTPQNPNRGKNPTTAPTRPVPKPRVDVGKVQQRSLDRAVVADQRLFTDMALGPEMSLHPSDLPDPFLNEARDPGGDSRDPERCDDQVGENAVGNIQYLPRERFREGRDGCRATGIVADFSGPDDMDDGTKTAWKADCETGQVTPPDYYNLPPGRARARGHLAGCQFGGSGTDLRNLVPLHRAANSPAMSGIENRIANEIRKGQNVHYEVTPVYGNSKSGIPAAVHIEARGGKGMDVDCYVINQAANRDPVCSSEIYRK